MSAIDSPWTLPQSAASTHPHELLSGHTVQLWSPAPAEPHLRAWYEPVAELCRAIRAETIWRLHLEDCRFRGRVDTKGAAALWLYSHERALGEVLVDLHGHAYLPREDRRRKLGYRFEPIRPRNAAFELGLHRLDEPSDAWEHEVPDTMATSIVNQTDGSGGARILPFRRR